MAEQTEQSVQRVERLQPWQGGVVAGILAGAVMGALMVVQTPPVIEAAIPALWGLSGGAAGWTVHLSNSAMFGVAFAAVARWYPGVVRGVQRTVAAGVVYGIVLWVLGAVLLMPVWLDAVGFASPPPLPNVAVESLVAHVAYGIVLGAVYPFLDGRTTDL